MYSRPEAAALVLCVKVLTELNLQYPLALDKAVQLAGSNDDKFETALDQLTQMAEAAKEQYNV
jgi:hypothetical protein